MVLEKISFLTAVSVGGCLILEAAADALADAHYFQPNLNGNIRLVPALHRNAEGWTVEFKIGSDHLYVLKDITAMVNALKEEKYVYYG
ncbi:hypothetical protein, partial [Hungatella sp. SL.1.14]|uniref:hypothetical protein n=1 Tax=Hungatella sp. SL.1.14 TaxID=2963703 RepID=UPI00210B9282